MTGEFVPECIIAEGVTAGAMSVFRLGGRVMLISRDYGTTIMMDDNLYSLIRNRSCPDYLAFKLIQRGLAKVVSSPKPVICRKIIEPCFFLLDLTNSCNFSCSYCFRGDVIDGSKLISGEMLKLILSYIVNFCRTHKMRSISIQPWGGEPLLAFSRVVDIFKTFDGEDIECRVTMMTNGAMITSKIAEYLYANHADIGVSLDGPPDIQNSQRPSRDGSDSYALTLRGIRFLEDAGYRNKLGTISVITRQSIGKIHRIVDHIVRDVNISCLKLNLIKSSDGQCLAEKEIASYCADLLDAIIMINRECYHVTEGTIRERLLNLIDRSSRNICISQGCCGGYRMVSIDASGNIYPCEMTDFSELCMGNILEGRDLTEVVSSSLEKSSYFVPKSKPECDTCAWFPYCKGGCTAAAKYRGCALGVPDESECALNRNIYPKLVRLILEQPEVAKRLAGIHE